VFPEVTFEFSEKKEKERKKNAKYSFVAQKCSGISMISCDIFIFSFSFANQLRARFSV